MKHVYVLVLWVLLILQGCTGGNKPSEIIIGKWVNDSPSEARVTLIFNANNTVLCPDYSIFSGATSAIYTVSDTPSSAAKLLFYNFNAGLLKELASKGFDHPVVCKVKFPERNKMILFGGISSSKSETGAGRTITLDEGLEFTRVK